MQSRRLIAKADALLKKEQGTVYKDPGGRVNICLVYPNHYYVGMSSLAFQGLYSLINSRADALAERAFLPEEDDIEEFRRSSTALFSFESKRPLREFHVLAFSVSFENDYPNVITILELAGIPPRAEDRDENYPIVIGGGVALTANPEPLAEVFDGIFIGEVEDSIDEILTVVGKANNRTVLLKELMHIQGFYVPLAYKVEYNTDGSLKGHIPVWEDAPEKIIKRTSKEFHPGLRHSILTEETEFSNMTLVEVMRGCPWRCAFCLAGHIYAPVKHKPFEMVKTEAGQAHRVGLIGPSLTEYRFINQALQEGFECSITSVRASHRTLAILEHLKDQRSVSIAPESSERLRIAMGKVISDEEVINTAREVLAQGPKTLRCYFMVGLPGETDRDIEDIINLVKAIRSLSKKGKVVVSVSVFVPKPHTPLQWHPMAEEDVVKERIKRLKKALGPVRAVEVFHEVVKYAYLQGLLSRGDRRLSPFLMGLNSVSRWQKEVAQYGLSREFYLFRHRDRDEVLPWDFIEPGFTKEQLWQRYQQILTKIRGPAERHT